MCDYCVLSGTGMIAQLIHRECLYWLCNDTPWFSFAIACILISLGSKFLFMLPPIQAYDQHLNMILGDVEETVTTVEIDDETYEEIVRVSIF